MRELPETRVTKSRYRRNFDMVAKRLLQNVAQSSGGVDSHSKIQKSLYQNTGSNPKPNKKSITKKLTKKKNPRKKSRKKRKKSQSKQVVTQELS